MNITVTASQCDVPARVIQDAIERVAHATRFFDRLDSIRVVFTSPASRRIASGASVEVSARAKGRWVRVSGDGRDHGRAVDVALDRFERRLARLKLRESDRRRGRDRHRVERQVRQSERRPAGMASGI